MISNSVFVQINPSTTQAVLLITSKTRRGIVTGFYYCVIFLDLCQAFDTVDKKIFLSKLANYGIRGTPHDWFISCLSGRSQCVSFDNATSDYLTISRGVSQRSILRLLLFLLYINDYF